ncbi:MAG: type II toxin-antitoxin system HicB family antitoxin [Verrucomicrobia bacterium]|nr:type II toxin-antitoxin system HicB family antitoxin [Verrucomicrobiota bacterium]
MDKLKRYQKAALKLAHLDYLGPGEGYGAKIPGFPGLIVFGETKRKTLTELESALEGWVELSLKRGYGLPSLRPASAVSR